MLIILQDGWHRRIHKNRNIIIEKNHRLKWRWVRFLQYACVQTSKTPTFWNDHNCIKVKNYFILPLLPKCRKQTNLDPWTMQPYLRKKSSFWWLWLINLFKDGSVESCTSNIDQSVLIRAFSQSLLFPERRHYIPEKSNLRSDHSKALWGYYTWDPWRHNFDGLIFIQWRGGKRSSKST